MRRRETMREVEDRGIMRRREDGIMRRIGIILEVEGRGIMRRRETMREVEGRGIIREIE